MHAALMQISSAVAIHVRVADVAKVLKNAKNLGAKLLTDQGEWAISAFA